MCRPGKRVFSITLMVDSNASLLLVGILHIRFRGENRRGWQLFAISWLLNFNSRVANLIINNIVICSILFWIVLNWSDAVILQLPWLLVVLDSHCWTIHWSDYRCMDLSVDSWNSYSIRATGYRNEKIRCCSHTWNETSYGSVGIGTLYFFVY